jgi:hypothetical protein
MLSSPMLIDTTKNALYAMVGVTPDAVESIDAQLGTVTSSPTTYSIMGPAFAQDSSYLYMGVYTTGGEIAKFTKQSITSAPTLLSGSFESEVNFEWLGVVTGSSTPLCVQTWSPNGPPYNAQALLCGSSASGAPTSTIDSCPGEATVGVNYCYACYGGPNASPTACAPPTGTGMGAPTAAAADANGLVWADSTYLYSVSSANLAAKPTNLGGVQAPGTPTLMVLDANNVYWTDNYSSSAYVFRAPRSSPGSIVGLPFINNAPSQLAVDSEFLYWADTVNNEIMAVAINTQASNLAISVASALATTYSPAAGTTLVNQPTAIAVDGTYLYWYNSGNKTIAKMTKQAQ